MSNSPSLQLPAPAKLNLFLHILGRRDDGYHNLQTLFHFLDYGDQLEFSLRQDKQIVLTSNIRELDNEDNLIYRAATLLQQHNNCPLGASITLHKQLPMGAGLGGGSSNAATTLVALNKLWQCKHSRGDLQSLGLQLGADVPIFIAGETAWAEGIGEQLQPIELAEHWYLILIPDCHISTAEIFSHKDLTRDTQAIKIAAFLEQGGHNDCEDVVRKLYPEVDNALNWLAKFSPARMTGTGACVFAQFSSRAQAEDVLQQVPGSLTGFVAKGVNQSPLYATLAKLTK